MVHAKIADLWDIVEGKREEWKPKHILSRELLEKWSEIEDDKFYRLEVSIAFDKPLGKEPDPSKVGGETRLRKYQEKLIERDEQFLERETHFQQFINHYGEINSAIVDLNGSFGCEVEITGKGLKDLVVNYQFVFEVTEVEDVGGVNGSDLDSLDIEVEILPPENDASEVGVIDSGIMENHKFLEPAIRQAKSKSYVRNDNSTADYVSGGGHGTKVAGAILYPNGVSNIPSPYILPAFIRNLRVLNRGNMLDFPYPAELMKRIVEENQDCSIFNLSINTDAPCRLKHMSSWAAIIDKLIHEKNILFLISTGNISTRSIKKYLSRGDDYPDFLQNPFCKIANPGQSSFAVTVGSVNSLKFSDEDWETLGEADDVSAFSRIGPGIWGMIKPDLVEYGGELMVSKNGQYLIRENQETNVEFVKSTLYGGRALGKDSAGTSFSTPKVGYIVAQLHKRYPNEGVNLLRALLIQGARLPKDYWLNPNLRAIQHFGYGLPSLERVTNNSDQRITFYNTGDIKVDESHLFSLRIPEALRSQANEYNILIEVTLAYTAKTRRTRQRIKSYLSTWLDWSSSKLDESFDEFKNYTLKEIEGNITQYDQKARNYLDNFGWKLRRRNHLGNVQDINRNNSTIQKDWAIIEAYRLPEEVSFAVTAHKGWDKNNESVPYALTVSFEVLDTNVQIYQSIKIENEVSIEI